jgi:uncharacterized membrane protein
MPNIPWLAAISARDAAKHDYDVNLKAELETEFLHQKLDLLRGKEIGRLIQIIKRLEARLSKSPMSARRLVERVGPHRGRK